MSIGRPYGLMAAVLSAGLLLSQEASSSSMSGAEGVARTVEKLGPVLTKTLIEKEKISLPPPSYDLAYRNAEVEALLKQYSRIQGSLSDLDSAALMGTAVSATPSLLFPSPPTVIFSAATVTTIGVTNALIQRAGKKKAVNVLDAVVEQFDGDTAAFTGPQELGEVKRYLEDLRDRIAKSNDGLLISNLDREIEDKLKEMGAALSPSSQKHMANLRSHIKTVRAYDQATLKRLNDLSSLTNDIRNLSQKRGGQLSELNKKIGRLGANQGLIVDFMFSSIPAKQKVLALRSGLMDDRLKNDSTLKKDMIAEFETEANIQEAYSAAGKVLHGLTDVSTIIGNLGIDIGKGGRTALRFSQAGVSAFMQAISGNPLGAIASITGIFAKDPAAERHRIMMRTLQKGFEDVQKRFDSVDEKLKNILENQEAISKQIVQLSKQLRDLYLLTREGLTYLTFEQGQMSQNLRELIWRDWQDCHAVYQFVSARDIGRGPGTAPAGGRPFTEFSQMRKVIDSAHGGQLIRCLDTILRDVSSITATGRFGYFLDAKRSVDRNAAVPEHTKKEYENYKEFLESKLSPLYGLVKNWSASNKIAPSRLLQLEMSGPTDVRAFRKAIGLFLSQGQASCRPSPKSSADANPIIRSLLCSSQDGPDTVAGRLRGLYMDTDMLLTVVTWMVSLSQLADLYVPQSRRFARTVEDLASLSSSRSGEIMIRHAIVMLSLGIAQYQRLYGSVAALALASMLEDERLDRRAFDVLKADSYLLGNAVQFMLWNRKEKHDARGGPHRPEFFSVYSQALVHAQFGRTRDRFLPLQVLLGDTHRVGADRGGSVGFFVRRQGGGSKVDSLFVPLPSPERLAEGDLRFPIPYDRLVSERRELISIYAEYLLARDAKRMLVLLR